MKRDLAMLIFEALSSTPPALPGPQEMLESSNSWLEQRSLYH
jgi:hypothetical protein